MFIEEEGFVAEACTVRVGHGFHVVWIIVAPLNRDISTELAHLFILLAT